MGHSIYERASVHRYKEVSVFFLITQYKNEYQPAYARFLPKVCFVYQFEEALIPGCQHLSHFSFN